MSADPALEVMLADDSALFREGLARILAEAGFTITATVGSGDALLQLVGDSPPDIAVVDVRMPPSFTTEGIVTATTIRTQFPNVGVLVLSKYVESRRAMALLESGEGRVGYLLKDRVADPSELVEALRRIAAGGSVIDPEIIAVLLRRRRVANPLDDLTDREREILGLMAEGRSNHGIAETLVLSPKTIETHVRHIFTKLGLHPTDSDHRRVMAVLACLRS